MKFFILANLMPNLIPNFIKKIEFKSNFKVVELEFELEPCDIGYHPPGYSEIRPGEKEVVV